MRKNKNHQRRSLTHSNRDYAKRLWGESLEQRHLKVLQDLTDRFGFAIARGEIQLLNGNWYVTHAGLLRLAERRHCAGNKVQQVRDFCDPATSRWVFKATLYKRAGSLGFVGFGDANPSNVSPLVRGAEMRMAETRAVNRALRKAYGIGICSVEELKWLASSPQADNDRKPRTASDSSNASNNGHPRLRDQLCLLIRQYDLDSNLVKAYATDFCGTQSLKEASRERVESFISHLAACAKEDRDALVCRLNSYAQPVEVKS